MLGTCLKRSGVFGQLVDGVEQVLLAVAGLAADFDELLHAAAGLGIAQGLLKELYEPLMSVSLIMPGEEYPLTDPYEMRERLEHEVDLVIDGEFCGLEPTTVVEFVDETPNVLRVGKGDVDVF